MQNNIKSFFKLLLISTIFWVVTFILFTAIRYNGIEQELSIFTDDILYLPIREYFEHAIIVGLVISVFYTFIEFIFDRLSSKSALGLVIVFKSIIYFILIVVVLSGISFLLEEQLDRDIPNESGWWRTNPYFWITVVYFVTASIIFSLFRIANDRFGQGNFISILLGKYKRPREEEHILMFIDLKDSTVIAEKLGHNKYSQFIQDCFIDLDKVLSRYYAKVYQYVGDEAVVHWALNKGFRNNNCIRLFLAFQKRLNKREQYYSEKYDFNPKFKAGMHFGKIMVVEVGSFKKELAFHGDVINTAARIQGCCNEFNENLLVSGEVLNKLKISNTHHELMSRDMELRGKSKRIKIYAIKTAL